MSLIDVQIIELFGLDKGHFIIGEVLGVIAVKYEIYSHIRRGGAKCSSRQGVCGNSFAPLFFIYSVTNMVDGSMSRIILLLTYFRNLSKNKPK